MRKTIDTKATGKQCPGVIARDYSRNGLFGRIKTVVLFRKKARDAGEKQLSLGIVCPEKKNKRHK